MHADQLILYAPNVHTGGGLVLLQALLSAWPRDRPLLAFLDKRASARLTLPNKGSVMWVNAVLHSRLLAEFKLRRLCHDVDTVFCLHNLPPAVPVRGKVVVFHQNRILLGLDSLRQFPMRVALRISIERLVARIFRHRVSQYVVQTPTMAQNLARWYLGSSKSIVPLIRVLPFVAAPISRTMASACKHWDFIYVADGEAHKNHHNLLQAWELLAQYNLRPSLALTLSSRDTALKQKVDLINKQSGLNIRDIGTMQHEQVLRLYTNARALIFPSTSESFGLPLIEASQLGLPILASELDYVRDVCVPAETFDPNSPVSIARAVKRFLECPEPTVTLKTPAEFWGELLQDKPA